MKTTFKTIAFVLVMTITNFAFAGGKSEKVLSSELDVKIETLADGKVLVQFHKQEGELVKVKIYDSFGSLIHIEKETEGDLFAKRYDLSAFPSGDYTYSVSNDIYSVKKVLKK